MIQITNQRFSDLDLSDSTPKHLEWLRKKVILDNQEIRSDIRNMFLSDNMKDVFNSIKAHSILKEISLPYILSVYNPVMSKAIRTKRVKYRTRIYLDTFAGSGFIECSVAGSLKSHWALGSPIHAVISTKEDPLDYYIFVEKNEKFAVALEHRLNKLSNLYTEGAFPFAFLKDRFKVINNDVNKSTEIILKIIDEFDDPHVFINNDPYGLDMEMKTLSTLLKNTNSDLLHNDMIGMIRIELPNIQKYIDRGNSTSKLSRNIGLNHETIVAHGINKNFKSYLNYYLSQISSFPNKRNMHRTQRVEIPIQMASGKSVHTLYNLHFFTIHTKGGSPFLKGIYFLKNYIEKLSDDDVKWLMNTMYNGQTSLNSWFD